MENLGIATPKVNLLPELPRIGNFITKTNFDSGAHSWASMQNSTFFTPLLTEAIIDPAGTFAALHPSKRIYWTDNYLSGGGSFPEDTPYITWTPTKDTEKTIMDKIYKDFDDYPLIMPGDYLSSDLSEYLGPIWFDDARNREPVPNDEKAIEEFLSWVGTISDTTDIDTEA